MTTDRDPEIGSILEELEAAAENALNPVAAAGGAMADAASSIMSEFFDGAAGGGPSGGGESGGGGSTDPWDPTAALPDPTPEVEIPPELEAIINPVVDPNEPWRIN